MKVEVHPPNPAWKTEFESEAQQVKQALGDNVVTIHHIGSTSIPYIYAKPIIDLLVEVQAIADVDRHNDNMIKLGYEVMGEYGIPGRRYFRKETASGTRTHHVHVFEVASPEVKRHLAFRDFMIAHPEYAQQYSELKRQLAAQHHDDIDSYMHGKHEFIQEMERQALEWKHLGT